MKSRWNSGFKARGLGCEWDEVERVWGEKLQMRYNFDEGEKSVFSENNFKSRHYISYLLLNRNSRFIITLFDKYKYRTSFNCNGLHLLYVSLSHLLIIKSQILKISILKIMHCSTAPPMISTRLINNTYTNPDQDLYFICMKSRQ